MSRAKVGFAAMICAGLAVIAVPLFTSSDQRPARNEDPPERPAIVVPVAADESLIPDAARAAIDRAVARCRREQSAEAFAALGRIYHGNGLTRLAAKCYELASQLGAADAQTPYFHGLILFEEGFMREAIDRFIASIERDATYPLAHHHLGRSRLNVGEIEAAVEAFAHAVELDPHDPVLLAGKAKALRHAGRLEEAEAALRAALNIDDDHSAAHQLLGLILHATDRSDEAERHLARLRRYNATVYNDPWLWDAYRHAASVDVRVDWARNLLKFGRIESAIAMLEDLAQRNPSHHRAFSVLAEAYLHLGDHQRAVNSFVRAADLDPADARSRLAIAQILVAYELFEEADETAKAALEIEPDLAEALAVRGAVALRTRRLDEARAIFQQVLDARPDFLHAAALMAETLIELEQFEQAVDVLDGLLPTTASGAAYAEYQLASALLRLGRTDRAAEALARAAEIEPDNEQIQHKLALIGERTDP